MGEIADMMLDGTLDCETGEWNGFDEAPGFPMTGADAAAYRGHSAQPRHTRRARTYSFSASEKRKIAAIGELRQCDDWHFQIRKGKAVLLDWWPHKRRFRVPGQKPQYGEVKAALAATANQTTKES